MDFDPGYAHEPFAQLVAAAPSGSVYRKHRFRTEWGPIFHRGRLDGTARVLVIGQDPAAHETIARRILCGHAGHRVQGFLDKLGIDRSYVMINTFLYALYDLDATTISPAMRRERHDWIDALLANSPIEAVVTFGTVARQLWEGWLDERAPATPPVHSAAVHPSARLPEADHLVNWNAALELLRAAIVTPDHTPRGHYGTAFTDRDVAAIPAIDFPPGIPEWMRAAESWAVRGDPRSDAPTTSRVTVTIPAAHRVQR